MQTEKVPKKVKKFMEVLKVSKMENVIKSIIGRFVLKSHECTPPSQLNEIRKAYEALPTNPTGKVAPQWQKKKETAGMNGADTS